MDNRIRVELKDLKKKFQNIKAAREQLREKSKENYNL